MNFNGQQFFKVGEIKFCVSRAQPSTTYDYYTSYFRLHKIKDAEKYFVANVGMEKSYHPNGIVSADYEGTLGLEFLEPNKLISESEALALAKEYVEALVS